jgi:hypothetical protein
LLARATLKLLNILYNLYYDYVAMGRRGKPDWQGGPGGFSPPDSIDRPTGGPDRREENINNNMS